MAGGVANGHVAKLSAVFRRQIEIAPRHSMLGIAVTVLPATDLFLVGARIRYNVPRGVTAPRSPGAP